MENWIYLKHHILIVGDIYAIKCDEVFPNYIGIQNSGLTQLAQNYQIANAENVPDTINFEEYNDLLQITEEQEEHLKDTYMPIILNNIAKKPYIKNEEQISLDFETDNYTYNTNSYELRLSEETLKNILTSTLNTVRTETET